MLKSIKIIISIAVVLTLFTTINLLPHGSNYTYANSDINEKSTLSISGSATVKADPDIAYINVGVKVFNADLLKAQNENKEKMNKVMRKLKELEISDKDIKTIDYRIEPKYEWKYIEEKSSDEVTEKRSEQVLLGYDVTNKIKVTVKELEKVGKVIDLTVEEGINEANNIYFDLSEQKRDEKYAEALKNAVLNAKSKAEMIGDIFNIKLGIPFNISESGSYFPTPIQYRDTGGYGKDPSESVYFAEATPIVTGEMEIKANVSLIYKY